MNFFKNFSISKKLIVAFLIAGIIPALVVTWFSIQNASESLRDAAYREVLAIRELKALQIEDRIRSFSYLAETLAKSTMVVDAMKEFKTAFRNIKYENEVTPEMIAEYREKLWSYYEAEFKSEYKNLNNGADPKGLKEKFAKLDDESIILQYYYIRANQNPLGSKHLLDKFSDGSEYSELHAKYHPVIRHYLETWGFYDIFLVDPQSGDIVYSVFKELDYSTSLSSGPYASTNFGRVFQKALNPNGQSSFQVDLEPYFPSYEAAAGFVSSPIYDGNDLIGVLIMQNPVQQIDQIMTNDSKWKEIGMGESGETYLVGSDFKMRSNSRFLIEQPEAYFAMLRDLGVPESDISLIKIKDTSALVQKVNTVGTKKAMQGQSDVEIFDDYRGVAVVSAYKPLQISGLNWALMSEVDEAEALEPINKMQRVVAICLLFIAVGVILMGIFLSRIISAPLIGVSRALNEIERDSDLSKRVPVKSKDEVGQMSSSLNKLLDTLKDTISEIRETVTTLVGQSEGLLDMSNSLEESASTTAVRMERVSESAQDVSHNNETLAASVEEMSCSVTEVSQSSQEAASVATETTVRVKEANELMADLDNSSAEIGQIVELITTIAEQTNLLALNATIEAARAGDVGKGFAVVANEVKELASETSKATSDITAKVQEVQARTGKAVTQIGEIAALSEKVDDFSKTVAAAVEEQSATSNEMAHKVSDASKAASAISENVGEMTESAKNVSESSLAAKEFAQKLAEISETLSTKVKKFKIDA